MNCRVSTDLYSTEVGCGAIAYWRRHCDYCFLLCRGKLQTDCFDINGQASCFVDKLAAPTACRPVSTGDTNVTQPLQDMLADGSAADGSDGSVCKLYEDAGANIGATSIAACTQGLVCTPLQVWHSSLMLLLPSQQSHEGGCMSVATSCISK